jgi:hypothetical protein
MKNLFKKHFLFTLGIMVGAILFAGGTAHALTLWYLDGTTLKPVDSSWGIDMGTQINLTVHDTLTVSIINATSTTASSTMINLEILDLLSIGNTPTTTISGSATSTFASGLRVLAQGVTFAEFTTCTALETDGSGNLVCGSDSIGSATDPNVILTDDLSTLYLKGSTTRTWLFDDGFVSTASSTVGSTLTVHGAFGASTTAMIDGLSTLAGFYSTASSSVAGVLNTQGHFTASSTSSFGGLSTFDLGLNSLASSTFGANLNVIGAFSASSTAVFAGGLQFNTITSAMMITAADGLVSEYAGTSCTNQFPQSQSVLGAWTCSDVTADDVDSTVAISARQLTMTGTTNEITLSAGAQDLTADRTWTFSLPNEVFLGTSGKLGRDADNLIDFNTDNEIMFRTNSTDNRMIIKSDGRIGVASTSPFAIFSIGYEGAITTTAIALGTTSSMTIDWTQGNQQEFTLGVGAHTFTFEKYVAGQHLRLVACQNGSGSGTITWPTTVYWSGQAAPTLTTTAEHCDVLTFLATNATSTNRETTSTSTIIFGSSVLDF